ncbi:hypothetical protein D3C84_778080 [compost metagenome]
MPSRRLLLTSGSTSAIETEPPISGCASMKRWKLFIAFSASLRLTKPAWPSSPSTTNIRSTPSKRALIAAESRLYGEFGQRIGEPGLASPIFKLSEYTPALSTTSRLPPSTQ